MAPAPAQVSTSVMTTSPRTSRSRGTTARRSPCRAHRPHAPPGDGRARPLRRRAPSRSGHATVRRARFQPTARMWRRAADRVDEVGVTFLLSPGAPTSCLRHSPQKFHRRIEPSQAADISRRPCVEGEGGDRRGAVRLGEACRELTGGERPYADCRRAVGGENGVEGSVGVPRGRWVPRASGAGASARPRGVRASCGAAGTQRRKHRSPASTHSARSAREPRRRPLRPRRRRRRRRRRACRRRPPLASR